MCRGVGYAEGGGWEKIKRNRKERSGVRLAGMNLKLIMNQPKPNRTKLEERVA